jgi:iron complex outermembrane receptor protein
VSYDLVFYDFELNNTIVVQEQINGADFFHNAGSTSQKGIEASASWWPLQQVKKSVKLWGSYTYNHFKFEHYVAGTNDFSGNWLTGVAKQMAAFGADFLLDNTYANLTMNYVDKVPLDDGNTAYATAYIIAGARFGVRGQLKKLLAELYGGVDNVTNTRYSLGNDLNAAGGRYYNVAPARNFYLGLKIGLSGNR